MDIKSVKVSPEAEVQKTRDVQAKVEQNKVQESVDKKNLEAQREQPKPVVNTNGQKTGSILNVIA